MKNQPTTIKSGALPRFLRATCIAGLLPAIVLLLSIQSSHAGSAKWKASPATGDWNTAANWTAGGPPNGSADTATFASSNITGLSLSLDTEVNGIVFNAGASAFTITASPDTVLSITGAGITNNSGITQNFVPAVTAGFNGTIEFTNSATAGSSTAFTNNGGLSGSSPSRTQFHQTSTANNGVFTNNGGTGGQLGGVTNFLDTATAANGTFTNNGGSGESATGGNTNFFGASTAGNGTFTTNGGTVSGANGGQVLFFDTSTAGDGTFTSNGVTVNGSPDGGHTVFFSSSSAGNGTFTNNGSTFSGNDGRTEFNETSTADNGVFTSNGGTVSGGSGGVTRFNGTSTASNGIFIANGGVSGAGGGSIFFNDDSIGGTSRVEVFGNGNLDVSGHNVPGLTVGSVEGSGAVFLGADNLTVGSNNLSTAYSGVIQDGANGTGGSLTKIGRGKLTLSKASTYTGGTTVSKGTLLVTNRSGSATGTGTVQVKAGTLGGTGKISGAVTVASGTTLALLAPGIGTRTGTLTTLSTLVLNFNAAYAVDINSSTPGADQVVAKGVTINSAALVTIDDLGTGTLTTGTVFTVISNTAATPIAGTFGNLADNSTLTVGSNTYLVSYEGGTGNDLTLTAQ